MGGNMDKMAGKSIRQTKEKAARQKAAEQKKAKEKAAKEKWERDRPAREKAAAAAKMKLSLNEIVSDLFTFRKHFVNLQIIF